MRFFHRVSVTKGGDINSQFDRINEKIIGRNCNLLDFTDHSTALERFLEVGFDCDCRVRERVPETSRGFNCDCGLGVSELLVDTFDIFFGTFFETNFGANFEVIVADFVDGVGVAKETDIFGLDTDCIELFDF